MKKKILMSIGIITISIVAIMITVFLLSTHKVDNQINKPTISVSYLQGEWRVTQHSQKAVKNEYWIFNENSVSNYRDGKKEAYITSQYSISQSNTLCLSDVSKEFIIEKVSNNILKLVDTENKEVWCFLRCSNSVSNSSQIGNDSLNGDWNVLFHAGQAVQGESMSFDNGIFTFYRNEESVPFLESKYSWNANRYLFIAELNREFEIIETGDNTYGFIETDTGYIWEIEKKN